MDVESENELDFVLPKFTQDGSGNIAKPIPSSNTSKTRQEQKSPGDEEVAKLGFTSTGNVTSHSRYDESFASAVADAEQHQKSRKAKFSNKRESSITGYSLDDTFSEGERLVASSLKKPEFPASSSQPSSSFSFPSQSSSSQPSFSFPSQSTSSQSRFQPQMSQSSLDQQYLNRIERRRRRTAGKINFNTYGLSPESDTLSSFPKVASSTNFSTLSDVSDDDMHGLGLEALALEDEKSERPVNPVSSGATLKRSR